MLIADIYGKFPIIQKLTNMSSSTIINHLKRIFDEHGIPERSPTVAHNTALKCFGSLVRDTGSITLQAHRCILGRMDS